MASLSNPAVRGTLWTILEYGSATCIRFASNLILTRLLQPEYFGLMALVNTLRVGLELMSDMGIGQSIIQNRRGEEKEFLDTAWTLQIIRGFCLWGMALLLTMPLAHYYGKTELYWVIPIVGFTSVLDGLTSTSVYVLYRRMQLGPVSSLDMITMLFSTSLLILWAKFDPSLRALVFGGLIAQVLRLIATHTILVPELRHRIHWDKEAAQEIFSFGKWLFVGTAMMFLSDQADRLILGKQWSFELLGVYTIAFTMATLPREVLKNLSHRVLFPTIAKHVDKPRHELRQILQNQRKYLLLGSAIGIGLLTSWGDIVISTLYDQRYAAATWMLPIMGCGVWFSALLYSVNSALVAVGKPLYSAQCNLMRLVIIAIGLPTAFYAAGGITGKGILADMGVIVLSDVAAYLVLVYGLAQEKMLCLKQDGINTAIFVATVSVMLLVRKVFGLGLPLDRLFT
jgi:O-antigen/teichoic acid export membrane protein